MTSSTDLNRTLRQIVLNPTRHEMESMPRREDWQQFIKFQNLSHH